MTYFACFVSKESFANANVEFWKECTICIVKMEQDGFPLLVTIRPPKGRSELVWESHSSKPHDVSKARTFGECRRAVFHSYGVTGEIYFMSCLS